MAQNRASEYSQNYANRFRKTAVRSLSMLDVCLAELYRPGEAKSKNEGQSPKRRRDAGGT